MQAIVVTGQIALMSLVLLEIKRNGRNYLKVFLNNLI